MSIIYNNNNLIVVVSKVSIEFRRLECDFRDKIERGETDSIGYTKCDYEASIKLTPKGRYQRMNTTTFGEAL
jgi:hypothetical protein